MAIVSSTSTGTSFISGLVSGIDTTTLIQAALDAKLAPKKRLDDQISKNTNKITAFKALQTQTESLRTALGKLKTDLVIANAFSGKAATYASSNSAVSASSILSASVSSSAQSGSYNVVVNSTAKAFTAQSTVSAGSISTALGYTGTFDIGAAGKTAATINVTPSMTLQEVAAAINNTSSTSGVAADLLQTAPGQYSLIIRGTETNKAVTVSNITGDNVLQNLNMTDAGGTFLSATAAAPASITINNTTVTSDSNTFSNVLTGVTLNVANADPATTITVNVVTDTASPKLAIEDFVAKYNTLRSSIDTYRKVGENGVVDAGAYLYNESLNTSLAQLMNSLVVGTYGNSSVYNGLSALGITLDGSGKLNIDNAKLTSALANNYNDVRQVFETNGSFAGFADTAYTLLDDYSNVTTGNIAKTLEIYQTRNTEMTKKADEITTRVEAYQQELINKYAKMETKIKAAETLKKQILAILEGSTQPR